MISKGRYAPSPTGPLHRGNLRTALIAWLQSRLTDGAFILRIEDLDQPRVRAGSDLQIMDDLRWLGLEWDEGPDQGGSSGPYYQSQRGSSYQQVMDRLQEQGLTYGCGCSRKEISKALSAPHANPGVYPGTCRNRAGTSNPGGRVLAHRFRLSSQPIRVVDEILPPRRYHPSQEVGDFIVQRADGLFAYQLAVVVDDAQMGVTDVVRGADLAESTVRQLSLYQALGLSPPRFWHLPVMVDGEGRRLSKRDGSGSITSDRKEGISPERVVGQLAASLGLVPAGSLLSAVELAEELTIRQLRSRLRLAG